MPEITDEDGFIKAGLSSDIMRLSMESKGLLDKKGSIYIGTGESIQVNYGAETVSIAKTTALSCEEDNCVLIVKADSSTEGYDVCWGKITPAMIEDTNTVFSVNAKSAEHADSVTSSVLATYVMYDDSQKDKASQITLDGRLGELGI